MPVSIRCECGKQLRVSEEHIGKRVRCPECKEPILVPDPDAKKPAAARDTTTPRKPAPRGEDDDRKPARSRRDDDDEDRKPVRGRRDEDDEDDRPAKGTKGKKGKPARKGGGMLWVIVGASTALVLLIGLLLFLFMGGSSATADLALVPGDAAGFASVRPAELLKTPLGKDLLDVMPERDKAEREALETKIGLTLADLDRATVVTRSFPSMGPRMGPGGEPDSYAILTTSKPVDAKKVLAAFNIPDAPKDYNGKKYYANGPGALYFHSDRTTIIGNETGVKMAIDQAVKPKSTGDLSKLLGQVGSHHFAAGGKVPAELANLKQMMQGPFAVLAAALDVQTGFLTANIKNTTVEVELAGSFATATQAQATKDALDGMKALANVGLAAANLPPATAAQATQALSSLSITQRGNDVVIAAKMADLDVKQLQGAMPGFPGMGGGGNMGASNHLKQIGVAFHNYASANNDSLPPWGNLNQQRRPLLSWRVHLLPYLEQDNLYKQINKSEAWDHPSNRPFHSQMPRVFELPGRAAPPGQTFFQVFVGPQAIFDRTNTRFKIGNMPDGLSNTLLVAEAARPVNWMEPADIDYRNTNANQGFIARGNVGGTGPTFLGLLADGSVRSIPMNISPRTLNLLIHPADGVPVPNF